MRLQVGDNFFAIVKKSEYSKTLGGDEGEGKEIGVFKCTYQDSLVVETDERLFKRQFWNFRVL